jgi:hypothetical protein
MLPPIRDDGGFTDSAGVTSPWLSAEGGTVLRIPDGRLELRASARCVKAGVIKAPGPGTESLAGGVGEGVGEAFDPASTPPLLWGEVLLRAA